MKTKIIYLVWLASLYSVRSASNIGLQRLVSKSLDHSVEVKAFTSDSPLSVSSDQLKQEICEKEIALDIFYSTPQGEKAYTVKYLPDPERVEYFLQHIIDPLNAPLTTFFRSILSN